MGLLSSSERAFLQAVADLGYCNPFLAERVQYERQALGADFHEAESMWSLRVDDPDTARQNPRRITARVEPLLQRLRGRLVAGAPATDAELRFYEDAVLFWLFHRYQDEFYAVVVRLLDDRTAGRSLTGQGAFYEKFLHDWQHYFALPGVSLPASQDAPHLFACFFQIRRAFHHIFQHIVGSSRAAARLRATVWQSIFTHDMRRYRRCLYDRMGDFTTLIAGPSGTGKELVARAIGLSRYVPFDATRRSFTHDFIDSFSALNLSALPSTLIESELFGHRRGAFTGALQDRRGWLEVCPPLGAVFLDEIGDLDAAVQVKLLRVLRRYQGTSFPRQTDCSHQS
jgi:hypothetical protein